MFVGCEILRGFEGLLIEHTANGQLLVVYALLAQSSIATASAVENLKFKSYVQP